MLSVAHETDHDFIHSARSRIVRHDQPRTVPAVRCDNADPRAGRNTASAIVTARGPDSRTIPIAPRPGGVAIAAIVSISVTPSYGNSAAQASAPHSTTGSQTNREPTRMASCKKFPEI